MEKIVCLMINTEFFKTRSSSIRRFLSFLVQAFSNKKYMFLNSTKMINQGDIHFLYFVSRKITAELDRIPAIVDSTNEYDFWKLFVLNVLQKYEDAAERLSSQAEGEEECSEREKDGDLKVEIDEVALIKEIVRKIEVNKKWNCKKESHPAIYRIGSASELNKKKSSLKSEKLGTPGAQSRFRNSINQDKMKPFLQDLQQESKDKSVQFIKIHSQEAINIDSSHNSSEELDAIASQSFHSDTEMEQEARQKEEKDQ